MIEVWKDIPGYEGAYQVSNFGRIRSLDRTIEQLSRYGTIIKRKLKGRLLKLSKCSNGYLQVSLGAGNLYRVHQLVAQVFVEGDTTLQVNHKNGNKKDNYADNLEWITCSDNHLHAYRELSRKKHALTRKVRLTKGDQVLRFDSGTAAAKYLNVVAGSIASAATKNHKCNGFEVNYV